MANHTRQLAADAINFTTVDNNAKAEAGAEPPMVQVSLWQDLFNAALDAHWTVDAGLGIYVENGTVTEFGGKVAVSATGINLDWRCKAITLPAVFNDLTVETEVNNFDRASCPSRVQTVLAVFVDNLNWVRFLRYCSVPGHATNDALYFQKKVAGVYTLGAVQAMVATNFKLKLIRSGNNWTAWYDIGGGWVQLGGTEAAAIGADCKVTLEQDVRHTVAHSSDFLYCRITGSGYYWDDSPEADIVDSVNIGVGESYAFDAGAGNAWALTGASSVQADAGGSNKWKMGFSDNADGTGVTWDAAWRTIAQVNTNAANGNYDGHRYLYVKWQGNSDGSQNVNATLFTITSRGVNPLAQAHHDCMRRIKYDTSRISP